jgi:signal transduction histidine kinase
LESPANADGVFLVGYAGVATLVIFELESWILVLTGVVFCSGALFVYMVVHSGYLSMAELLATKDAEAAAREAKEFAEASNRAKSEFLAMMSHEIRNADEWSDRICQSIVRFPAR